MEISLQVGVKALLRNSNGKYLLLKRSLIKYPEVIEPWDIIGGRITPGKTLIDNLKREIKEETQLELTAKPELLYAQDILRIPGRHVVRVTYKADIEGEPVIDLSEHDEFKWVTLEQIYNQVGIDSYAIEALKFGIMKK
jgi:ADP-ribose pyrophosphatase YjhB (NUDIX family)